MTTITLEYALVELPSSQHRAGLAGLVMMLQWLSRQPGKRRGVAELVACDAFGATVRFDQKGIAELFDAVYRADTGEVESATLRKDKQKQTVPPLREENREELDAKGKVRKKTVYVYPTTVPHGALLVEADESERGVWVKLWRDAVWAVLRGVPAQRKPYEARAEKQPTEDAAEAWEGLRKPDASTKLASTYFIGAQERSADDVTFRDRHAFLFLLHFWPFATMIYRPQQADNDGKTEFVGYAVAIPDVCDLSAFVEAYGEVLRRRPAEVAGYVPRAALIDVVEEGGLDLMRQMRERLAARLRRADISDLVLAVDVVHLNKDGNNVRLLSSARVEPGPSVDEYERLRGTYWDVRFRQVRLRALVTGAPWHHGLSPLISKTDWKLTFGRSQFRHDARAAFTMEARVKNDADTDRDDDDAVAGVDSLETLVFRTVKLYLHHKLQHKHQLEWSKVQNTPKEKDYHEKREDLARAAFLAARSRTGPDFVEFFTNTLCSVPQRLREDKFLALAKGLQTQTEDVRTFTLLALSAQA